MSTSTATRRSDPADSSEPALPADLFVLRITPVGRGVQDDAVIERYDLYWVPRSGEERMVFILPKDRRLWLAVAQVVQCNERAAFLRKQPQKLIKVAAPYALACDNLREALGDLADALVDEGMASRADVALFATASVNG